MAARMWKGPTPEMHRAHNDPLFSWIVRRCAEHGVQIDMELDGRRAVAFKVEQAGGRCGTYFKNEIKGGDIAGTDPWNTVLHLALALTPFDAELLSQYTFYIDRQAAEIEQMLVALFHLEAPLDELIASVRA